MRRRSAQCVSSLGKWFLLLPPAFLSVVHYALGRRHCDPLSYACPALRASVRRHRSRNAPDYDSEVGRGLAVALGLGLIVAAAGIYPDDLSYMNESACLLTDAKRVGFDGGSKCGYWLDDSNVDWGAGSSS